MSKEKYIESCGIFKKKIHDLIVEIDVLDEDDHMIFLSGGLSRVIGSLMVAENKLQEMIEDLTGDDEEVDEEEFMKDFFADKNGENFDFDRDIVFGFEGKPE